MTTTIFKAPKGYESYKTAANRLGISVAQMRNAMNNRAEFKASGAIITVAVEGYDAQFKYLRTSVVDRYQRRNAEAPKRRGPRKAPAELLQGDSEAIYQELKASVDSLLRGEPTNEPPALVIADDYSGDHPDDHEY